MLKTKGKIQVGIYLISVLMMGVVGIASAISVIGANFPELSQTDVQTLISIPCIIIIPVTLIVGKLMQVMSKKLLAIIGIILFLIGGLVPAFMTSFLALQILRGVFGVGVGILQVVSTALVAENFEGAERDRVQGNLQAFQMLGCAIMVFVGGWLATMGWNTVFYVHIIGAISLIVALVCLPNVKPSAPAKAANSAPAEKGKLTGKMWVWMIIAFFVFCTGQLYSNGNAYLLTEKGIGDSAASGLGMAFFCAGGIIMGLLYGKLASALKDYTMGVGFIVMALSYAVMAMAPSIAVFYVGCLIFGLGMSVVMPGVFLNVGNSVGPAAVGMALSIATCVQNFGQFCSPYLFNPIAQAVSGESGFANVASFYVAAGIGALLGVIMLIRAAASGKKA